MINSGSPADCDQFVFETRREQSTPPRTTQCSSFILRLCKMGTLQLILIFPAILFVVNCQTTPKGKIHQNLKKSPVKYSSFNFIVATVHTSSHHFAPRLINSIPSN